MRRLMTASLALVGLAIAQPVDAQLGLQFGPQVAYMTGLEDLSGTPGAVDFNGTFGAGARVIASPTLPMLSIAIVGQGIYYFPPDGADSYMTYGLGGRFGFSLPLLTPYVIGGYQWRRSDGDTETGFTAGAGVQLGMIPVFVEATMEFNDEIPTAPDFDNNPLVLQAGVLLGG